MKRALLRTTAFVRAAKRFTKQHPDRASSIRQTLQDLEADAFAPRLRTHKLKGDLADCWSATAGYDIRIVFQLVQQEGAEAVLLLAVGTHDEVY